MGRRMILRCGSGSWLWRLCVMLEPLPPAPRPLDSSSPRRLAFSSTPSRRKSGQRNRGSESVLRLVVDKKELPLVREWRPLALKLKPGPHRLSVDLLDRRGTKVRNAVNRTDRAFTLPE